jgi:hypothetical protein
VVSGEGKAAMLKAEGSYAEGIKQVANPKGRRMNLFSPFPYSLLIKAQG